MAEQGLVYLVVFEISLRWLWTPFWEAEPKSLAPYADEVDGCSKVPGTCLEVQSPSWSYSASGSCSAPGPFSSCPQGKTQRLSATAPAVDCSGLLAHGLPIHGGCGALHNLLARSGEAIHTKTRFSATEAPCHQLVSLPRLRLLGRRRHGRYAFGARRQGGPLAVARPRPGDLESLGKALEEGEWMFRVGVASAALCGLSPRLPPGATICQEGLFQRPEGRLVLAQSALSRPPILPPLPRNGGRKRHRKQTQAGPGSPQGPPGPPDAGLQAHRTCWRGPQAAPSGVSLRPSLHLPVRAKWIQAGTRLHLSSGT